MSEYIKEFEKWWYKPLYESAINGIPDKDMMKHRDLGKQSAFHAWQAREPEITKLKKALVIADEAIGFYADKDNWDDDQFTPTVWDDGKVDMGDKSREAQKQIKEILGGSND